MQYIAQLHDIIDAIVSTINSLVFVIQCEMLIHRRSEKYYKVWIGPPPPCVHVHLYYIFRVPVTQFSPRDRSRFQEH